MSTFLPPANEVWGKVLLINLSLSRGSLSRGALSRGLSPEGSVSRRAFWPEGSLSRGSLARGVSIQGVSGQGPLSGRPLQSSNKQAVCILLECILVVHADRHGECLQMYTVSETVESLLNFP